MKFLAYLIPIVACFGTLSAIQNPYDFTVYQTCNQQNYELELMRQQTRLKQQQYYFQQIEAAKNYR